MGKFDQIVESAWADAELYPESVPHVLHQDLTYLWVLEKDARQRPNAWRARIEAWRHLVALFFSGDLLAEVVRFPEQPLLSYMQPYGLDSVTFLRLPRGTQGKLPETVGVLSSTVLVRPLPDFHPEWLPELRAAAEQKKRPEDVGHFLHLALQQLAATAGSEYTERLSRILRQEFSPAAASYPASGNQVLVPMLRKLEWAQRGTVAADESKAPVTAIPLLVRAQQPARRTYVPRCVACNLPLTRGAQEAAIAVMGDSVEIQCRDSNCGTPNTIALERFLIWNRDSTRVVAWQPDPEFLAIDMEVPPPPEIQGIEAHFTWNSAHVGGDALRCHLRLQFTGKSILAASPGAVFFKKLLIPGKLEELRGYPVRPEWADGVDVSAVIPRTTAEPLMVDFEGVRLRGWPVPIALRPRVFSIVAEPALAAGIFPSPSIVGPRWRWFRSFLAIDESYAGAEKLSKQYRLITTGAAPLLPHVHTSTEGVPEAMTITSSTDDGLGVTYFPRRTPVAATVRENAIAIAVDFGTTNTVVYHRGPDQDLVADPSPSENAIAPRHIAKAIHWLAQHEWVVKATNIAGFLPGPAYRTSATDGFIFPSTVWELSHTAGELVIRWSAERPAPQAVPLAKFKWDLASEQGRGYELQRRAYLVELLLMTLASSAQKHGRIKSAALGVAFPLAFNYGERTGYAGVLQNAAAEVKKLTGIDVSDVYSISESAACVHAFGNFNPGETFLVADMGGGTLDVALFTFGAEPGREEMHQIGSMRYAGESFITALAQRQAGEDMPVEQTAWKIRDSVLDEQSHSEYGSQQSTEDILKRFTTFAFEYLRTMIAAHHVKHSPEKTVNLVFVGNGWNLAAAFSRRWVQDGYVRIVEETYDHLTGLIGEPNVRVYRAQLQDKDTYGSSTRYSKHLVAIGALKNTREPQRKELLSEPAYGRLPAGRAMKIADRDLAWSDLVGAAEPFTSHDGQHLRTQEMTFNLVAMAPLKNPSWRRRLLDSLGADDESRIPYPDEAKLREQTRLSISGEPPKVERGPLQLIIEQYWSKRLARGRQ